MHMMILIFYLIHSEIGLAYFPIYNYILERKLKSMGYIIPKIKDDEAISYGLNYFFKSVGMATCPVLNLSMFKVYCDTPKKFTKDITDMIESGRAIEENSYLEYIKSNYLDTRSTFASHLLAKINQDHFYQKEEKIVKEAKTYVEMNTDEKINYILRELEVLYQENYKNNEISYQEELSFLKEKTHPQIDEDKVLRYLYPEEK